MFLDGFFLLLGGVIELGRFLDLFSAFGRFIAGIWISYCSGQKFIQARLICFNDSDLGYDDNLPSDSHPAVGALEADNGNFLFSGGCLYARVFEDANDRDHLIYELAFLDKFNY